MIQLVILALQWHNWVMILMDSCWSQASHRLPPWRFPSFLSQSLESSVLTVFCTHLRVFLFLCSTMTLVPGCCNNSSNCQCGSLVTNGRIQGPVIIMNLHLREEVWQHEGPGGGRHRGIYRLLWKTNWVGIPSGVYKIPSKQESSVRPTTRSTLKPTVRRTVKEIILSFRWLSPRTMYNRTGSFLCQSHGGRSHSWQEPRGRWHPRFQTEYQHPWHQQVEHESLSLGSLV